MARDMTLPMFSHAKTRRAARQDIELEQVRASYLVIYVGDVHDEMDIVAEVIGHDPPEDVLSDIIPASLPPYSELPISRLVYALD